ncbi:MULTISPECIES: HU family DNA-binding protein [Ruminococcus]|uniref:Bacterial nucleoid DNA-binding protein n=1 Tax=Ruminococcus champanellensis (strain DSM 18848 / JCM 17042 / KCTC 15320 / 18P13) TaxID=213810 RepID=D4LC30_RUMC1|nr:MULTISPECIES: HU family DNA-binding protein [Ruminococcus]MDY4964108.1 HU family DNA-binding protein [Ruminococcus callidus]MCI5815759.1 HU family DNA-binding protein [Ruminococcus sp.]MDD7556856.1 HU family DNA-binding protein [Ruminococcus sp.]MED9890871.1 HU family DNA-binding protein [Ruminococcus champanellensis]CBL17175.1 Bacterial nucleoid DNA-binding protein [Ruminococcus champanellensis 18P13 = JCM 17042]
MTKADLVKAVSEKANCPKKDAEMAINTVIDCITDAVAQGEKVQIVGFGTFEVRERGEKKCKNPRTGEEMITPAKKAPVFKAGKALKDAVNK